MTQPVTRSRSLLLVGLPLVAGAALLAAVTLWPAQAQSPAAGAALPAAQEAQIRKSLSEQLKNFPKIDELRTTPMPGVIEVRYAGSEILYTDARGEHVLTGSMIEVKSMANLTEARLDKLAEVAWSALPLKDAIVIRQGAGTRKLAVFADPNCGYCKRFERDLAGLKDVTVYTFLMPILGPDSAAKSRDVWCSREPAKAWRAWMVDGTPIPKAGDAACDSAALERNVDFGRKHRVNGTPALFFEDGTRRPGALPADQVEKLLAAATAVRR